jgi:hypothetical protein
MTDSWGLGSATSELRAEAAQVLIEEANQEKQELHDALLKKFADEMRTGEFTPSSELCDQVTEYRGKVRGIDRRIEVLSSLEDLDAARRQVVQSPFGAVNA